jgi:glycyl-tRNA synthetase beta subunit
MCYARFDILTAVLMNVPSFQGMMRSSVYQHQSLKELVACLCKTVQQ